MKSNSNGKKKQQRGLKCYYFSSQSVLKKQKRKGHADLLHCIFHFSNFIPAFPTLIFKLMLKSLSNHNT